MNVSATLRVTFEYFVGATHNRNSESTRVGALLAQTFISIRNGKILAQFLDG